MDFILYTKNFCPYCTRAKDLLKSRKFLYKEIDVQNNPDIRELLVMTTGMKTVPQIFDCRDEKNKHVGGYDNLVKYLGT